MFQDDSLVVDLDGDGAPEVIIAYPPKRSFTPQYAAVAALNGATGELRWLYQFPAFSTENLMMRDPWSQWMVSRRQIAQVTVGPDLDGDGKREVFVASRFMPQHGFDQRLFVEALSGATVGLFGVGRTQYRAAIPTGSYRGGTSRAQTVGRNWSFRFSATPSPRHSCCQPARGGWARYSLTFRPPARPIWMGTASQICGRPVGTVPWPRCGA